MNGMRMDVPREWRQTFEYSEYHRELQTENWIANRNTREINLSGKGKYLNALLVKFRGVLNAADAEAPLAGVEAIDLFLDDLRIRGAGKGEVMNMISSDIAASIHERFVDEVLNQTALPTFVAPGAEAIEVQLIIPLCLPLGSRYYSLVIDAANVNEGYAADVTLDAATIQVNVISGDTPCRRYFTIESQTLLLPPAGRSDISTVPQGAPIPYIHFVNFADDKPPRANLSNAVVDTIEWELPNGEHVIFADYTELRDRFLYNVDYPVEDGELGIALGYKDAMGVEIPWSNTGRFTIETIVGAGEVKSPDMWFIKLAGSPGFTATAGKRAIPPSFSPPVGMGDQNAQVAGRRRVRYRARIGRKGRRRLRKKGKGMRRWAAF